MLLINFRKWQVSKHFTSKFSSRLFAGEIHPNFLVLFDVSLLRCIPILMIFQQRCTARVIADSILNLKEKGLLEVKSNPASSVNETAKDR